MTLTTDFSEWWSAYPRRVGKLAALKAYTKARSMASAQELLSGIDRYKRAKPDYADFCFPATFLNQGRWMDEADAGTVYEPWTCPHDPPCGNRASCAIVSARKR